MGLGTDRLTVVTNMLSDCHCLELCACAIWRHHYERDVVVLPFIYDHFDTYEELNYYRYECGVYMEHPIYYMEHSVYI